jgi:hypothetical protein
VKEKKIGNVIIGGDVIGSIDIARQIHEKLDGTKILREKII